MRSNEQLVQETLLAQLSEYQHQQQQLREFDIVDKIGKGVGRVAGAAAKSVGAVAGGVAGLGQAVKKGYQAGKATTGAGGADPAASGKAQPAASDTAQPAASGAAQPAAQAAAGDTAQPEAAPAKAGGSAVMKGLQAVGRGIGAVGDLKSKVQGYDVVKGTELQQRASANNLTVAQQKQKEKDEKDAKAKAADTTQAAQPAASDAAQPAASAAPTVTATGGGVAPIATTGAAPKATTVPGQKPAATGAAPKATTVPGQKPAAEPAKTAQDIAAKTGAATPTKKPDLKIAGQKVKPTDPLYDKLVAMIPAETRSSIDGLSDYDKGRLKKELSA